MQPTSLLHFGPFCCDMRNASLQRGEHRIRLTPKAFTVLCYLIERAGQLATKEAILQAVWPETTLSETALAVTIRELRRALGDDARTPRFIETVHRRGYRFIGTLLATPRAASRAPAGALSGDTLLIGREAEQAQLAQWFAGCLQGERQCGLIVGDTGIGKTTLVQTFVARLRAEHTLWVASGQCIKQYGAGEAYLPLLEALGRLGREPDGQQLIPILRRYAPTWWRQLPALHGHAAAQDLQGQPPGVTHERMLREMAEAVEVLTTVRPLLLVLEDLHWSDAATIAWLAYVARRSDPARLLLLGTYRQREVLVQDHPLRAVAQELSLHGQCTELRLEGLSEASVATYLTARAGGHPVPEAWSRIIHQRTNGNPLFMVLLAEAVGRPAAGSALAASPGLLTEPQERALWHIPESVQRLIALQMASVEPDDQELLAAASVAGVRFAAAAVAAGVERPVEDVEHRLAALARQRQFIQEHGTAVWPDGTTAASYSFLHALYQEVVYTRLPTSRRQRLHQAIGTRLEAGYGAQADDIAAELAGHFEQAQSIPQAVAYRLQAGKKALQRSAYPQAIAHLTSGMALLSSAPQPPEAGQIALLLQSALGTPLSATQGYAAVDVAQAYRRAQALGGQAGEVAAICWSLHGLSTFHAARAEWQTARTLATEVLAQAQRLHDPTLCLHTAVGLGTTTYFMGDFVATQEYATQGLALYDPAQHHPEASGALQDAAVQGHCCLAGALWQRGAPTQARQHLTLALRRAQELEHPYSLAYTRLFTTLYALLHGEDALAHENVEALLALATAHGFSLLLAAGMMCQALLLVQRGDGAVGLQRLQQSMLVYQATGAVAGQSYVLAGLAQAHALGGQQDEAMALLERALRHVEDTGERFYEAELYRFKGRLLLHQTRPASGHDANSPQVRHAEDCFAQALRLARQQQAQAWELHAALELSRLWWRHGKQGAARQLLERVYGAFREGHETAVLQETRTLLAAYAPEAGRR